VLSRSGREGRRQVRIAPTTIEAGGRTLALVVRRRPQAKRIILRLAATDDALVLTLPPAAHLADGLAFAESARARIAHMLDRRPPRVPFADGAVVPVRGEPHLIVAASGPRGVSVAGARLMVGGREERLAATLGRWLGAEALAELSARSQEKAARLGTGVRRPLGRVRVKEMRTRWGSCSPSGDLNYAWRLILAPVFVLDYVAAHEVAHLAHAGHDRAFWSTCARLASADPAPARAWLREQGPALLRYG
jgi:predicted metal-dependent hydrolase